VALGAQKAMLLLRFEAYFVAVAIRDIPALKNASRPGFVWFPPAETSE
jgi:hypothetical protein